MKETTMAIDVSNYGSDAEIFKFDKVGTKISGTITEIIEQPVPETFVDGKPQGQKLSRKGKPLTQWVVTLDTDNGLFRFYTKWRMEKAIVDAARRVGEHTVSEGAYLTVTREDDISVAGAAVPAQGFSAEYDPALTSAGDVVQTANDAPF